MIYWQEFLNYFRFHNRCLRFLIITFCVSAYPAFRVWSLETLQCIQTLTEHTSVVMSVLCWDQFLLSCSLDKTIKVWVATQSGKLEVTYTHNEEHVFTHFGLLRKGQGPSRCINQAKAEIISKGVLTLCGMHDVEAKPILLCSCTNNSVHVYDLPSFSERGKIFAKQEVRSMGFVFYRRWSG